VSRRAVSSAWRDDRGQTVTEYLMVTGLLTAIIVVLTGIIVPGVAVPVVGLVRHMMVHLSTP
jgi:hypothetical protein